MAHTEFDIEIPADLSKDVELTLKLLGSVVPVIIRRSYLSLGNLREYNLKCQIRLHVEFEQFSFEMQCLIMTDAWFVSKSFAILAKNDIRHLLGEALNKINLSFDMFVQGGLGWTVHKFMKAMLVVDRCKRFKSRCTGRKSLPQSVRAKRALLHIQNIPTDQCFLYAVVAGLAKVSHNPVLLVIQTYC